MTARDARDDRPPDSDDRGIAGLGTAELLALRVEIRAQIGSLLNEKQRLAGQIHATASRTAWAGTPDERDLRVARSAVNGAITAKTALLDRIKLRLFELQGPPRPKRPADPRNATTEERAERLAALRSAGPDALLVRLAGVVGRLLAAAGAEMLEERDHRVLSDVSFYLRRTLGSRGARDRMADGSS